jgi:hypothetical protein
MGPRALLLWVALLAGFSPILADLVDHLVAEPWARYVLVFVPLCIVCLARCREARPRRADGFLWIAIAAVAELVAVGGNTMRLARPAFALAVVGLCRAFGLATARAAALCFWLVPVPTVLLNVVSPRLEELWLGVAVAVARATGVDLEVNGPVALAASGTLELERWHDGLPLVALLSGLGWYASLREGSGLTATLRRTLVWGLLGLPLQALAVLVAVAALAGGAPEVGRAFLDHSLWGAVAVVTIARIEWRRRAALGGREIRARAGVDSPRRPR